MVAGITVIAITTERKTEMNFFNFFFISILLYLIFNLVLINNICDLSTPYKKDKYIKTHYHNNNYKKLLNTKFKKIEITNKKIEVNAFFAFTSSHMVTIEKLL